jgi:hypothetical protein
LRKVAELQDEITQMRFNSSKQVGFQSPISPSMGGSSAPRRRVMSTPFPKLRSVLSPDATSPDTVDDDRQRLIEAVECSAFEYDGQGYTFIVRRPYGCEVDQDYWFKAGQHAAKRYAHAADVFRPESVEVAANIVADGSTFTLFGEGEVRHLTATGYSTEYGNVKKYPYIMGNVSYIDNEANDCEYSLEELFQGAMQVRDHYCAAVLSFATALKLKSPNGKSPFVQSPDAHPNVIPNVVDRVPPLVETADKAVETEPMVAPDGGANGDATTAAAATKSDAPKPPSKKGSPSPEEVGSTDLFIAAFSMIIRFVWFILIGLPLRILTTTFVMTMSIVLIAYLWLYLVDDKIAMGPSMHIYSNQAGIL